MTGSASPPLEAAIARSALVADALSKASEAHAGQVRSGSGGLPYIEHPVAVASLLADHDFGDEVLAAALLHDVVEDSETTVEDLRAGFGEPVASLVAALSDDESIADYRARKDEHRARVIAAGADAEAIYGADKLTNIGMLRGAYAEHGPTVTEEFKVPFELKLEIWQADLETLQRVAAELPFLDQLERELRDLRADLAATRAAGSA
ncbi:MAG TPA: HD domain-containing protein [Solirubrobacterales bacterium]|nr:HD domain-containing protein [Solirubrobacterales bacterium]